MVAAENGALPRGKVGGVGDVMRDLPLALAELDWVPTVLTPAYGVFGDLPGAMQTASLEVSFGGDIHAVSVLQIPGPDERVRHVAFEHENFSPQGIGRIYCDDGDSNPFATDATKFAFLSAVVAAYVNGVEEKPDVVHLHDWHAALYCALRHFDPALAGLREYRTVFTIHNLAMQGIRPFDGHDSSLRAWFPDLVYDPATLVDPRYPDCVNPMAAAIRLADGLNTVSPTYAEEILRPNDPQHGFEGGEGLEKDLQAVAEDGRLTGILNGCNYPKRDRRRPGWRRLLDTIDAEVKVWKENNSSPGWMHDVARERIRSLPKRRPAHLLTSIGRMTAQKVDLFRAPVRPGVAAVEAILENLGQKGAFIMLGSGDRRLEEALGGVARDHENFLFLCGYSESFSEMLYKAGDLFLMPSVFEPCGISQMLAMRAGQPCVVHAVGGLKDTVSHRFNGFAFGGFSTELQARNFVDAVQSAVDMRVRAPERWLRIRDRAAAARFTWAASAEQYVGKLYE